MNDTQSNVRPITAAQPQAHATFTITATIDGFPVQIEVEGKASDLRALVDRLKSIGAQPPIPEKPQSQKSWDTDDAPVCEFHGKMKRSNHGGFFCSRKMGDGSYCKSKA